MQASYQSVIFVETDTKCSVCARLRSVPYKEYAPPALPKDRVQAKRPFEKIGIDLFGPITIKSEKGGKREGRKVHGAIFVCMVSRAIHLELVQNASAEEFLNTFRMFCARRGVPSSVVTDNGTNFQAASKVVNEIWGAEDASRILLSEKVARHAASEMIKWKFNTERSSWRGGFFERLIGIVKGPLR